MLAPLDFRNLVRPHLTRLCPTCGGTGRHPNVPVKCEPCDGTSWVADEDGRDLLDVLGTGRVPVLRAK